MPTLLETANQHKGKIAAATVGIVLTGTELTGKTHIVESVLKGPQAPIDQQAFMNGAVSTVEANMTQNAPTPTPTIPLGSPTPYASPTLTGSEAMATAFNPTTVPLSPTPTALITETPTVLPSATATSGGVGRPSAVPTETATPAPTETVAPSTQYPTLETGGVSPGFDVDGVPNVVYIPANADHVPNNGPDADGNDHISKLGQYTGIASPGAYYYDGNLAAAQKEDPNIARDIISGVCSVQGSDTRINFGAQNVSAPVNEGTFREVETAGGNWIIHTPNGEINLTLDPKDNHAWMIVVKAPTQDGNTPADNNIFLELNGKDPFSNSTMTGKGSFMSQDMVDQIARAMHTAEGSANSSGADGSKDVTMIYVDSATGSWSVFETQFDAAGEVTGYKLVATNSVIQ